MWRTCACHRKNRSRQYDGKRLSNAQRCATVNMGAALATAVASCISLSPLVNPARISGFCTLPKHGLLAVCDSVSNVVHICSLTNGSLVRSVGCPGTGKGQFRMHCSSLCAGADGNSIIVADPGNGRLQEMAVVDGSWLRVIGKGVVLSPQYVDCNANVIAVSETWMHTIAVLAWADGNLLARFGGYGDTDGSLCRPHNLRVLRDGSGVVVADCHNHRLCVFGLNGNFVRTKGSANEMYRPYDVLEDCQGGFYVADRCCPPLIRANDMHMASLPHEEVVMAMYRKDNTMQVIRDGRARLEWIGVCVAVGIQT
jgi:hypothetical protein